MVDYSFYSLASQIIFLVNFFQINTRIDFVVVEPKLDQRFLCWGDQNASNHEINISAKF